MLKEKIYTFRSSTSELLELSYLRLWSPWYLYSVSLMSFIAPTLCHPTTLKKHSSYSFPTTPLVLCMSFPSLLPPQILLRVGLSEEKYKNFIPVFSKLTWMKYTRAETKMAWTFTPIGLYSCFLRILRIVHRASPTSFPCSVLCLTSWPIELRRETFLSNKSLFFFLSHSPIISLGFYFL